MISKTGGGGSVNKEAAFGKKSGADGGASNKDKITESNKIKKQKQEARARDINVKIDTCLGYLITLRSSSYVCQTAAKGKYGLKYVRQFYVDHEGLEFSDTENKKKEHE